MSNEKNKINDSDILEFLKFSYFGDLNISIEVASERAYRDMCRTIRFNGLCKTTRLELKKEVNSFLKTKIESLNPKFQGEFETWHYEVCDLIIKKYKKHKKHGIKLTYGQAQKWVNMTIKYLYLFGGYTFDSVFEDLHIPIDNYVFDAAKNELGIKRPADAWSKLDKKEYLKYQEDIREELRKKNSSPLIWEFENWLKEAQEDKKR